MSRPLFNLQAGQAGLGLSEMINAMAAQQQMYTAAAAYGSLEAAAYAQYPQYVTQVCAPAEIPASYLGAHAAAVSAANGASRAHARDPYDQFAATAAFDEHSRHRERRDREDRGRRDRERDRDRDRRDRDRDRGGRGDRDRDRERDRDRDRERGERDRDSREPREPRDGRWRDDDRDIRVRDSRDRDHRDHRDYDRDNREGGYDDDRADYKSQPPNNTIMVRGLAQHITENDIRADILACNLMPKDIRLVRKKESGASRGFAFVEFTTVHDATRWMEAKQVSRCSVPPQVDRPLPADPFSGWASQDPLAMPHRSRGLGPAISTTTNGFTSSSIPSDTSNWFLL